MDSSFFLLGRGRCLFLAKIRAFPEAGTHFNDKFKGFFCMKKLYLFFFPTPR